MVWRMVDVIVDDVTAYAGSEEASDDTTIVVIQLNTDYNHIYGTEGSY